MKRSILVVAAFAAGALVGGPVLAASALTPNDKACRSGITIPYDNGETVAYEACRFDKLDAAVKSLGADSPTPSPTASDAPTVAAPTSAPAATPAASPTPTVTPTTTTPSPTVEPTSASPSPTATAPAGDATWRDAGVAPGVTLKRVPQDVSSGTGWKSDSSGNVLATSGTAVLSGLLIPGRIDVNRATITNVKVQCIGENDWCVSIGSGSRVTNVEIGGQANGTTYGHAVALYTGGSDTAGNVIDRVLIHHQIAGIRLDGGTTVVDSYIRDLPMGDPVLNAGTGQTNTDDHSGGIMATRYGNAVLRSSRIEGGNTANLFIQHDVTDNGAPAIHDWLIEGNEFVNVAKHGEVCSWGVAVDNKPNTPGPFTVRNNVFTRGWQVGPVDLDGTPGTVTGNKFTDGSSI